MAKGGYAGATTRAAATRESSEASAKPRILIVDVDASEHTWISKECGVDSLMA